MIDKTILLIYDVYNTDATMKLRAQLLLNNSVSQIDGAILAIDLFIWLVAVHRALRYHR